MELVVAEGADPPTALDLSELSAHLNERLAQQGADLRNLLEMEQQAINFLEGQLSNHHERAKRVRRALAALEGTAPAQASSPKPTAARANDWQVSEERIEYVLSLFHKETDPITPTQLAEKTDGVSTETVGKAVRVLREREKIRAVKKVRGGGWSYSLMPEAADAA